MTTTIRRVLLALALLSPMAPLTAAEATFPGQNGKIAFVRAGDIYVVSPDGRTGLKRLTSTRNNSDPAWSADGRKITFSSRRTGNGDIYVMRSDGTGVTRVTRSTGEERRPTWSPDGQWLLFDAAEGVVRQRGISPFNGRSTLLPGYYCNPEDDRDCHGNHSARYSPDGRYIAYVYYDTGPYSIFGSGIRIVDSQTMSDVSFDFYCNSTTIDDPQWGPGGRNLLYGENVDDSEAAYCPHREGRPQQPVTDFTNYVRQISLTDHSEITVGADVENGTWSPRLGRQVLLETSFPRTDVLLAQSDGLQSRVLLTNAAQPDWQPVR